MAKQKPQEGANPRQDALSATMALISKQYGEGIIRKMGDHTVVTGPGVSTGSLALDAALGGRGFPRGRIIEVFGPESSGKTTLALHAIADCQKQGGTAAFIDVEHALDPTWARKLGVKVDELLLSQPDYGEQALEICDLLVKSAAVDIIVVDSVAALVPKSELEGEMGELPVGLQARLMSQALRKITASVHRANALVIFINQVRDKIGVTWGSPETTPGGRALKFYSSIRCDIRRMTQIKDSNGLSYGCNTKVKVVKNKCAPPFRQVEFEILFNEGISRTSELIELGAKFGLVQKKGAWLSLGETRLGQGKDNARQVLLENPDMMTALENAIREKLALGAQPTLTAKAEAGEEG